MITRTHMPTYSTYISYMYIIMYMVCMYRYRNIGEEMYGSDLITLTVWHCTYV